LHGVRCVGGLVEPGVADAVTGDGRGQATRRAAARGRGTRGPRQGAGTPAWGAVAQAVPVGHGPHRWSGFSARLRCVITFDVHRSKTDDSLVS
jgi:hypothetical protein